MPSLTVARPTDPAATAVLSVTDPADLAAAIPVLVGFRPRDSLVLIALGGRSGRRIGLTLRVDLPPPEQVAATAAHVAATLCRDQPEGAVVVVVGGSGSPPARPDVAAATSKALRARGIAVHTAIWVERLVAGAPWSCFEPCACAGVLPDPGATALAAASAAAGQVVYADRSELEELVAPADPAALRRREELIRAAIEGSLAGPDPGGCDDDAAHHAVLDSALRDAAHGRLHLDDDRVLALAAALSRSWIRDAAVERTERCTGAGDLWAALCRELPDPEAAEPAALLAAAALLRGDGALANVALDRAERSWPGHRLTALLRQVAELGLPPAQVRRFLGAGAGNVPAGRHR